MVRLWGSRGPRWWETGTHILVMFDEENPFRAFCNFFGPSAAWLSFLFSLFLPLLTLKKIQWFFFFFLTVLRRTEPWPTESLSDQPVTTWGGGKYWSHPALSCSRMQQPEKSCRGEKTRLRRLWFQPRALLLCEGLQMPSSLLCSL